MAVFLLLTTLSFLIPNVNGQCSGVTQSISVGFSPVLITPPGYPDGYDINLYCTWEATTSIPGTSIMFTIAEMKVPCPNDLINVYDGTSTSGTKLLDDECTIGVVKTINRRIALSGSLYGEFQSDDVTSASEKGFEWWMIAAADFSGTGCSGTPQSLTATTTEQYLTSPEFPNNYPNNAQCTWTITASESNANVLVKVMFSEIEPSASGTICPNDYLKIEENGTVLAEFCDNLMQWKDPAVNITSNGESLTIVFNSNPGTTLTGFFLSYVQIGPTVETTTPGTTTTTKGRCGPPRRYRPNRRRQYKGRWNRYDY